MLFVISPEEEKITLIPTHKRCKKKSLVSPGKVIKGKDLYLFWLTHKAAPNILS